jgi:predicted metal-dependent hydrolase
MILLVHMLFGTAIGSLTNNIYLGIIFALLSHYFADLIPHMEYLDSVELSIKNIVEGKIKRYLIDAIKVSIDFFLGIIAIYWLAGTNLILYIYAFVAILPDGFTVISAIFPSPIFAAHDTFHTQWMHYLTKKKKFSRFWKTFSQICVISLSVTIMIINKS